MLEFSERNIGKIAVVSVIIREIGIYWFYYSYIYYAYI